MKPRVIFIHPVLGWCCSTEEFKLQVPHVGSPSDCLPHRTKGDSPMSTTSRKHSDHKHTLNTYSSLLSLSTSNSEVLFT